jgi:hypothetical protein
MKMPKLNLIYFTNRSYSFFDRYRKVVLSEINDEKEDHVTTVQLTGGYIEDHQDWTIC